MKSRWVDKFELELTSKRSWRE